MLQIIENAYFLPLIHELLRNLIFFSYLTTSPKAFIFMNFVGISLFLPTTKHEKKFILLLSDNYFSFIKRLHSSNPTFVL